MTDPLDWRVRISSLPQALAEACDAAAVSPNAVILHDVTLQGEELSADGASLDWPSYFCDKASFVLVLAYLVRNNLPLEMDVFVTRAESGTSSFRIHPPLDGHAQSVLSAVNPNDTQMISDLNARAEAVLARLRRLDREVPGA